MIRTLLAALWMIVAASPALAELIDRKPVAGGAEVVLELVKAGGWATHYQYAYRTKAGIDWVFYREPVQYKERSGGKFYERSELPSLLFNEQRVALFFIDYNDGVIVTLDVDASSPKMHEDRFVNAFSFTFNGIALQAVDELVIVDRHAPGEKTKMLKRDNEGIWLFEGKPYLKNLESKVFAVPLSPKADRAEIIFRKPVMGGAEVVLERVAEAGPSIRYQYSYRPKDCSGWVFFREIVGMKGPDGKVRRETPWPAISKRGLWFDDKTVALLFAKDEDCIVVTLDISASPPKVHEDRFVDIYRGVDRSIQFNEVDQLKVTDYVAPSAKTKTLKRDRVGAWLVEGRPCTLKVRSKVSTIPLSPIQMEVLELKDKPEGGKTEAETHVDSLSRSTTPILKPISFGSLMLYMGNDARRARFMEKKSLVPPSL